MWEVGKERTLCAYDIWVPERVGGPGAAPSGWEEAIATDPNMSNRSKASAKAWVKT